MNELTTTGSTCTHCFCGAMSTSGQMVCCRCDFGGRVYRIDGPTALYAGTTTHRVMDATGVVHCIPAPGEKGCVLRWKPKDGSDPVQF